ncbi:MAG: M56 family metallopeptidase [Bacteroidales bacterium]
MGDIFVYILKSSLCLALFYLFFTAALSRETLYRFNRIVIVVMLLLALLLPLVNISVDKETPYSGIALNIGSLLEMANSETGGEAQSNSNSFLVWVLVIYIIGVVITFTRTIASLILMFTMLRDKESQRSSLDGGVTLIIHNKSKAPFSWMKYIVISRVDLDESGDEIITHEQAHIYNHHSIDLLVTEIVKIIHWFNPAAYLLKREIQNIHEYQADEAVIKNGIDAQKYQLLLIKKAVGDRLYSMANSFNQSKLKNRITMISKKKSQKRAALKALFLLPLSMFAVAAFATEEVSDVLAPVSELKVTDFIQKDTVKTKSKTIVVKKVNENVIVFVDGVEKDAKAINQIDSSDIKEVRIFKGEKAVEQYGDKAKDTDGVIIITTKYSEKRGEEDVKFVEKVVVKMSDTEAKPLYVVDGITLEPGDLEKINPKSIDSLSVLKGEAATKLYGEKGKSGVVVITLKK